VKPPQIIPYNYHQRIAAILDASWTIFKSQFINGRYQINKEAPFQHHFANIISTVGHLYCLSRNENFYVDLETKCSSIKGRDKYLDITCSFNQPNTGCAIELKFKTEQQGAQDHGRIDAYIDIEALELACKTSYQMGRFYMITNSASYINPSRRGVGTVFCLHDKYTTTPSHPLACPTSKGRDNIVVTLQGSYTFNWEQIETWYFLEVTIDQIH
jgi:hypothetical protein